MEYRAQSWKWSYGATADWLGGEFLSTGQWLYPDHASDRKQVAELKENRIAECRNFQREKLESAGHYELTIWCVLAQAMSDLGKKPEVIDYIETFTRNTDSCYAVFS